MAEETKAGTTEIDVTEDGMGNYASDVENVVASNMKPEADRAMSSPEVEAIVAFFETRPAQKAAFLKDIGEKLGLPIAKQIQTVILPTKDELSAKIRATLTRTAQEQSMPIHRDLLTYFTEALTEALYVAPPVDPENVEGVS